MRVGFRVYLVFLTGMLILISGCSGQASANVNSVSPTSAPTSSLGETPTAAVNPTDRPTSTTLPTPTIVPTITAPAPSETPVSAPTALPVPTTPPVTPQPSSVRLITPADNGKIIYLGIGEEFLLQLGLNINEWKPNPNDLTVVTPVTGTPNLYRTIGAGTVVISLDLEPPCRPAHPPCLMPTVLFKTTLVVK